MQKSKRKQKERRRSWTEETEEASLGEKTAAGDEAELLDSVAAEEETTAARESLCDEQEDSTSILRVNSRLQTKEVAGKTRNSTEKKSLQEQREQEIHDLLSFAEKPRSFER